MRYGRVMQRGRKVAALKVKVDGRNDVLNFGHVQVSIVESSPLLYVKICICPCVYG